MFSEQRYSGRLGNQNVNFALIKSSRARQVYLKVSIEKGLEIVIPHRFNLSRLPAILREKEQWIIDNLHKINEQRKARVHFQNGISISILGKTKILRLLNHAKLRPKIVELETEICMYSNESIACQKKLLEEYLKKRAADYIKQRTTRVSKVMNIDYKNITIKKLRSRWGSCSKAGNLNFNWQLILQNPAVIDYVIIHELAHIVHLNHSKRFYALVEKFCPEYKKLRSALKDHSLWL